MHFFIDENIPYAESFFSELGQVTRFAGRELTAEQLVDADVLLVRSITKVNEALLSKADKLKFVGTATIGEDHIDKALLANKGIAFSSAPGCNAVSVAEFVISALFVLTERYGFKLADKTVGIVGVGNIGKALKSKLTAMGINLLLCDPPRAEAESGAEFVDLDYLLANSDIVTFHTPKTKTGKHPSYHLLNETNISLLKQDVVLVNASRGEVVDNQALLNEAKRREQADEQAIKLVLDVWENEPKPLPELIEYCDLATAHIAGYSLEGKAKGTEMLYQQVCQLLALPITKSLDELLPKHQIAQMTLRQLPKDENDLKVLTNFIYDIRRDDALFKRYLNTQGFDWIRKNYPVRREWRSVKLQLLQAQSHTDDEIEKYLQIGFDI